MPCARKRKSDSSTQPALHGLVLGLASLAPPKSDDKYFQTLTMIYLQNSKIQVFNAQQVARVFRDLLHLEDTVDQEKEHFYVMHLDVRSQVKMVELVSLGILSSALVHPREVFRRAVMQGSASIFVAHNHPSGEVDPSSEDTKTTRLLFEAGQLLGIKLLDHIIFATDKFYSFKEFRVQKIEEAEAGKERKNP